MPIKTHKKIETIVLYFIIKKNLEISFQNGPDHETTSFKRDFIFFVYYPGLYLCVHFVIVMCIIIVGTCADFNLFK